MPGKHKSMAYKKEGPFKMKGSPMQRNFGIGSPMRQSAGTRDPKTEKPIVKGLNRGIKHGLKAKRYNIPKVPKGHSVTPPTSSQSKKSKGTLKGKTGFQTDIIPVTNVIKKGVKIVKKMIESDKKRIKKVKDYFTKK